jgi:hypothetical protein
MSRLNHYLEGMKEKVPMMSSDKDKTEAIKIMKKYIFTSTDWETGDLEDDIFKAMEAYYKYKRDKANE